MRFLGALLFLLAAVQAQSFETIATDVPRLDVADWKLLDLNGNGRKEILLLGGRGQLRTWLFDSKTSRMEPSLRGELTLPDASRTLLAWEKILEEGRAPQIVALSPKGAIAYLPDENGVFALSVYPGTYIMRITPDEGSSR